MWVIPVVRDEVIWIHETLVNFFRALTKVFKKEEKSAAKKVSSLTLSQTVTSTKPPT